MVRLVGSGSWADEATKFGANGVELVARLGLGRRGTDAADIVSGRIGAPADGITGGIEDECNGPAVFALTSLFAGCSSTSISELRFLVVVNGSKPHEYCFGDRLG